MPRGLLSLKILNPGPASLQINRLVIRARCNWNWWRMMWKESRRTSYLEHTMHRYVMINWSSLMGSECATMTTSLAVYVRQTSSSESV